MQRSRETRIDRLLRHLDRVIGPVDELEKRFRELQERLPPPPVPVPPFLPPLPGSCEKEIKQVVTAFYKVLREEFGEQRAEDIVRRAAQIYSQAR